MDKKIERLIDGASELARHFNSEDWSFWRFPKQYIAANKHLKGFLEKNKDIEVLSTFKKEQPQLKPHIDYYQVPMVKISEEQYEVHDSVRAILYNFCVYKLKQDLERFCSNVRTTSGIRKEDNSGHQYSYPYPDEYELREFFYSGVVHPQALHNIIVRNFHIRQFSGGRQFLNLEFIENLIIHSEETYDYSEIEL